MKIFVEQKNIQGELINISNDDWHHLTKVLRARAGDEVIACDGEFDYICQLSAVSCQLEVVSKKKCEAENKTHITIFQGVPKQAKMETIIAMCSELGVNRIVPFESEFCVASLPDDKKLTRWRKIALESAKQCGRDRVLDIAAGVSFDAAVAMAKELDLSFVCYEGEKDTRLGDIVGDAAFGVPQNETTPPATQAPLRRRGIGIFIGSEGGFTEAEIERAGLPTVSLGKRILRTQTVAPVVSAIVLNIMGEI